MIVYLDHAATSWPKPPAVFAAMRHAMEEAGGNPGRSSHRLAMRAAGIVYECRESLARLFGAPDPLRICFTANATEALNIAIKGLLQPGDHVVYSGMEHNAVWRPLMKLASRGVEASMAPAAADGVVTVESVRSVLRPDTRLIALIHASNVNGALNHVAGIGRLARERRAVFLVDAAQTAGVVPIDVASMNIDLLAVPGHKSLLGPQGTGALYVGDSIELESLKEGGTGSESASPLQPPFLPDRFESGTLNTPGIAGLNEGVKMLLSLGVENVLRQERELADFAITRLEGISGVRVYAPARPENRTGAVALNIGGLDANAAAETLDRDFGIACRAGLHCAPLAHRSLGTELSGAIRFSFGAFSTGRDAEIACEAVKALSRRAAALPGGRVAKL
jgi:cysteine desulfurase family protein